MAEEFEKCCKFKIALKNTKATRTVIMPEDITLFMLHQIIQQLFSWRDCHLWEIEDAKHQKYGFCDEPFGNPFGKEMDYRNPDETRLNELLPSKGDKITYTYDFGDGWEHTVTRMTDVKERAFECVKTTGPDGKENCGGPWGLADHNPPPADIDDINNRLQWLVVTIKKTSNSKSFLETHQDELKKKPKAKKSAKKK